MFRLFECCALSFFERFVLSFSLKIERFVSDSAEIWICGLYKYPKLRHQLVMRYIGYNEILDYIDELENKGYVYVIRHKGDMRVTRTTTNYHLLKELYDECRMEGEKLIRDMELISQISFAAIFRYLQEFS